MKRRNQNLQMHHWESVDMEMLTLWPISTYIPSSHVQHLRFDDSLIVFFCHCLSNSHTTTKSERARQQLSPQEDCQMCCKCHHFLSCSDAVLLMQVYNWPVGPKGLLYDRSWMVVNRNGVCLSQKRESHLCLIQPQVHLSSNRLLLQASGQIMFQQLFEKHTSTCPVLERFFGFFFPRFSCRPTGMDAISVPLKNTANVHSGYEVCQSKVCGDRCADLYRKFL